MDATGAMDYNLSELFAGSGSERHAADILAVATANGSFAGKIAMRNKDGKSFSALASHSALLDAERRVIGVATVIQELEAVDPSTAQGKEIVSLLDSREDLEKIVQERTTELNAANDNLRELSGRLLRMQDDERRRIARELHDSVGQLLAAVSINTAAVEAEVGKLSSTAARAISENLTLVAEINKEIRTISHLLHPPLLDEAGLASALSWYVRGFSERSKIKVSMDISPNFTRPTEETEIAIFRIVQESLTNIHRHSGSVEASVRVTHDDGQVSVEIRDRGKGIPQQLSSNLSGRAGVGIRGMRERIRQLGGTLEIRSDGTGTTVAAVLPTTRANRSRRLMGPT
ncbi:MAG: hypothetical protein NVS1B11_03840 [Terriglobales bacterium]